MFCIDRKGQQDPNDTLNLIIKQCIIYNLCARSDSPYIQNSAFSKKNPNTGQVQKNP